MHDQRIVNYKTGRAEEYWGIWMGFTSWRSVCFQSILSYYTLLECVPVVKDRAFVIKSNHKLLLVVLMYFCIQVFLFLRV